MIFAFLELSNENCNILQMVLVTKKKRPSFAVGKVSVVLV